MKTIVVSGADETFAPLLLDLIQSLEDADVQPFDAIGILDVGLSAATLEKLRSKVTHIVEPEWDFPVDLALQQSSPHLRALLARPFLRKYFPGYTTYLWMDADTWVQEGFALDWFLHASKAGEMALASNSDRSYKSRPVVNRWRFEMMCKYFSDPELASQVMWNYYNAGVFSLRADAPHWQAWEKYMGIALATAPDLVCDQTALNYAIAKENLPIHPLPALVNWCCHMAFPLLSPDGFLTEPHIPRRKIGIVHLSAGTKNITINSSLDGRSVTGTLRYRGLEFAPAR
jgi:lipopolysaccharide biosynthesis glycosyltransferase